jgi:hypothetical protein
MWQSKQNLAKIWEKHVTLEKGYHNLTFGTKSLSLSISSCLILLVITRTASVRGADLHEEAISLRTTVIIYEKTGAFKQFRSEGSIFIN